MVEKWLFLVVPRFYLCRRGAKGKPEKYGFDHVDGGGLARCPFFGLWVCGGFGELTQRLCRQVRRRRAEGFWEEDGTWCLALPCTLLKLP